MKTLNFLLAKFGPHIRWLFYILLISLSAQNLNAQEEANDRPGQQLILNYLTLASGIKGN